MAQIALSPGSPVPMIGASGAIAGVMGFQDKGDVQLIRHAYVRSGRQGCGIGGNLLTYLVGLSEKRLLVGTWKRASWAIGFYEKNGFVQAGDEMSRELLGKYWKLPAWHAEASLVLARPRDLHPISRQGEWSRRSEPL